MRRPIRFLSAAVAVALAGAAGLYGTGALTDRFLPADAAPERRDGPTRVRTVEAVRETVRDLAEAVGSTEAIQSIDLRPMSAGRVTSLAIREGAEVAAGDVLLALDDRAERAALSDAEASLSEARRIEERARLLAEQNVSSAASLETAEAVVLRAEAAVELARKNLEDRRIVAPFAGRVGLADVDLGEMVETATVVTSLDDLSRIDVTFALLEECAGVDA